MEFKKHIIIFTVIMTIFGAMVETAYGAPKPEVKKDWNISFLGTVQVPAQLEIVDVIDVIGEYLKFSEKISKDNLSKNTPPKVKIPTSEEIAELFTSNNIGVYQLALKNNGSYNTVFIITGKIPKQYNTNGIKFFNTLTNIDPQKQEELHKLILKGMDEIYTKVPDLQNLFQLEILEFYPFEKMTNKNAQIISAGGSVAVRTFKLIQPMALKVYFVNKSSEIYLFGVIGSGPDRKMWDDMTKEMLSTARWSWL